MDNAHYHIIRLLNLHAREKMYSQQISRSQALLSSSYVDLDLVNENAGIDDYFLVKAASSGRRKNLNRSIELQIAMLWTW